MRSVLIFVAILLLIYGVISLFSPFPGATLAIAAGLALLICASERAARFIAGCRTRFSKFDRGMNWIEKKAPAKLAEALARTRPRTTDKPDVSGVFATV